MILFTQTFIHEDSKHSYEIAINEKMITHICKSSALDQHSIDSCNIYLNASDYIRVDGSLSSILERIKSTEL